MKLVLLLFLIAFCVALAVEAAPTRDESVDSLSLLESNKRGLSRVRREAEDGGGKIKLKKTIYRPTYPPPFWTDDDWAFKNYDTLSHW